MDSVSRRDERVPEDENEIRNKAMAEGRSKGGRKVVSTK
jgi:hypothetical protein